MTLTGFSRSSSDVLVVLNSGESPSSNPAPDSSGDSKYISSVSLYDAVDILDVFAIVDKLTFGAAVCDSVVVLLSGWFSLFRSRDNTGVDGLAMIKSLTSLLLMFISIGSTQN